VSLVHNSFALCCCVPKRVTTFSAFAQVAHDGLATDEGLGSFSISSKNVFAFDSLINSIVSLSITPLLFHHSFCSRNDLTTPQYALIYWSRVRTTSFSYAKQGSDEAVARHNQTGYDSFSRVFFAVSSTVFPLTQQAGLLAVSDGKNIVPLHA
jgi:hypothetical protein